MKNNLAIKKYDIDYSFIIKNYTDQSLWDKKWTLFVYKDFVFSLELCSIDTKVKKIWFNMILETNQNVETSRVTKQFAYSVDNMTIKNLIHLINSNMVYLVRIFESEYIQKNDEDYLNLVKAKETEKEKLREIAENFLDNEGVKNEEIRGAYIDYYIDENEKVWRKMIDLTDEKKYTIFPDVYLILAEITEDNELKKEVLSKNPENLEKILEEVKAFIEYLETEEYTLEMQENLEAI